MSTYQRTELLCYMLGAIADSNDFRNDTEDTLIILDNILIEMKQLPMTKDEKEIIHRMHEQMEIFNIQMGMNRTTQRKLGLHFNKKK